MKNFPSVKKNSDFRTTYRTGRKLVSRYFVMYVSQNDEGYTRLGLSSSRKYGNSVERHRFQRRMREIFSHYRHVTKAGYDMIIVARNEAKHAEHSQLVSEYERLLKGHDIFIWDRSEL